MAIGCLCLYQHRGMQMDETNQNCNQDQKGQKCIGVKLIPNCLGNTNVFVKPNEQNKARFDSAMARKCAMKWNVFVKPDEQNKARSLLSTKIR